MKKFTGSLFNSYAEYMQSYIWADKRQEMLKKYPFCKDCGRKATQVHHTNYDRIHQEKEEDLRTLCFWCHKRRHNK